MEGKYEKTDLEEENNSSDDEKSFSKKNKEFDKIINELINHLKIIDKKHRSLRKLELIDPEKVDFDTPPILGGKKYLQTDEDNDGKIINDPRVCSARLRSGKFCGKSSGKSDHLCSSHRHRKKAPAKNGFEV